MGYSLNILNLNTIYTNYSYELTSIVKTYSLSYLHKDDLYDWLVTNALNRVLELRYCGKVLKHTQHDLYRHIYESYLYNNESIGYIIEKEIAFQIDQSNINIFRNEIVKLLILESTILIARKTNAEL